MKYVVVADIEYPLKQITMEDMDAIVASEIKDVCGFPLYWDETGRAWPKPNMEIKER